GGGTSSLAQPAAEHGDRGFAQGGAPLLAPLPLAPQVRTAPEHEGLDPEPGQIRATESGLDSDEQERVIAPSGPCAAIGRSEERVDLGAHEEVDGTALEPLV